MMQKMGKTKHTRRRAVNENHYQTNANCTVKIVILGPQTNRPCYHIVP